MWRVAVADLLHRKGRLVAAVIATGLAFGLSLLIGGVRAQLRLESERIVGMFDADRFVVAEGGTGPFTTLAVVPTSAADALRAQPGVSRADPFLQARDIVKGKDTFVLGFVPGGLGEPQVAKGRLPQAEHEVLAATALGLHPGDVIRLAGHDSTVVGTVARATYNFGAPTVFAPLADVQADYANGLDVATAIAVKGDVATAPAGTRVLTSAETITDLNRPQQSGNQTILIIDMLLWLMAAGIIATMVYLIALERLRDVAVLKAMGVPEPVLFAGIALHGLVLAAAALVAGIALAFGLKGTFPFEIALQWPDIALLAIVAVVVGLAASLLGHRRLHRVDPALAFGG